jgi:parallel beta-helix repeat protein
VAGIPDGTWNWGARCNDTAGNTDWTDTNRTLNVDLTNPIAYFGTNPVDDYNTTRNYATFEASCSDNRQVSSVGIWANWSGSWVPVAVNTTPSNTTWWNVTIYNIPNGNWGWGIRCNDTSDNVNWTTNRTITVNTGGCDYYVDYCKGLGYTAYKNYCMNASIINNSLVNDCIRINAGNVTFDCQGNSIASDDSYTAIYTNQQYTTIRNCTVSMSNASSNGIGIELSSAHYSIIDNCTTTSAFTGVSVSSSNYVTINNLSANYNFLGFSMVSSVNLVLSNSTFKDSTSTDFVKHETSSAYCNNTLSSVTGSGGRPIVYYNYSVNLANMEFSAIYLCNANNSNITNVNVFGSDGINNNGIYMYQTSYANLSGINSSGNKRGFFTYYSSFNTIHNFSAESNSIGIHMSTNSFGYSITDSTLTDSIEDDLYFFNPPAINCKNNVTNVNGSGGRPIGFYNYSVNISDMSFSSLILCNASYSNVSNVTVRGSGLNNNMYIALTSYSTFSQVNASNTNGGIYIYMSGNNTIIDSYATDCTTSNVSVLSGSPNNTFLNVAYVGETVESGGQLIRKWHYNAYVNDTTGADVSGANVSAYNTSGKLQLETNTNSTGWTAAGSLTEYVNNGGTKSWYSNYTIYASKENYNSTNHARNVSVENNMYKDVFTLNDTTKPYVNFVAQTTASGSYELTYIESNVTASDPHLDSIVVYLYNLTGLVNKTITAGNNIILNFTNLPYTTYYLNATANDTAGNINQTETMTITLRSPLSFQITKILSPSLILAYSLENIDINLTVKINRTENQVASLNITDEVPYGFTGPANASISVYYVDFEPYSVTDITANVTLNLTEFTGAVNKLIEVNITNTTLAFGHCMDENDSILITYSMVSSEMVPGENRTTTTGVRGMNNESAYGSETKNSTITAASVVLRGYKRIWTPDLSNPQKVSVEIILWSLGGTISNIAVTDYLPQGTTIENRNVSYYNYSTSSVAWLENASDYYVEEPSQATLPDGTYTDVYGYNFTYNYTGWGGYLYENDTLNITYNVTVSGGGEWILPTIIGGFDPAYKKDVKTEMYASANVPSFDVVLEMLTDTVEPGDPVKALLRIINVGGPRAKVDVFLNYAVKTVDGRMLVERSETIAVVEQKEQRLELTLPEEMEPGTYIFESYVTYTGREALSTDTFMVRVREQKSFFDQYGLHILLIIIIALLVVKMVKK